MKHTTPTPHLLPGLDVQASEPPVRVSLTRAGVTGVQKVIRIAGRSGSDVYYADIECSVDLDPAQKGVHMSRFPEQFAEAIENAVHGDAPIVEALAEQIARGVLERQGALRSHVSIEARYPVERITPVSGLRTQEITTLLGSATATAAGVRRAVGVRVRGFNACPCAQGMVRDRASERLSELGYGGDEQARILDAIPIATHNQRAEATLMVGSHETVEATELIDIAEASMSAPARELLKRPDELYVVELAHLHPRFVEDSVRLMVAGTAERWPELPDSAFVLARQVNFETIHNHDVVAERSGLLGDLRHELAGTGGGKHVTLEGWLAS